MNVIRAPFNPTCMSDGGGMLCWPPRRTSHVQSAQTSMLHVQSLSACVLCTCSGCCCQLCGTLSPLLPMPTTTPNMLCSNATAHTCTAVMLLSEAACQLPAVLAGAAGRVRECGHCGRQRRHQPGAADLAPVLGLDKQ